MYLTVLGSAASYAAAGQACAGHLVRSGETAVLLDCGNGVLPNLSRVFSPAELDGVFISHVHPDHVADLYSLQALLRYAPEGPAGPLDLYGPAGLLEDLSCLLSARGAVELREAFSESALGEKSPVRVGELSVTAHLVEHSDATYALVVEGPKGRLCYSSDTRPCDALVEAARGADVLLAESTLPAQYAGMAPHMTASEAASVAKEAGVAALVLTHLWPTADHGAILEEARGVFSGEVILAEELLELEIGRPRTAS